MVFKYVDFFRNSPKYQALDVPFVDIAVTPKHKKISFCTTCMNRMHNLRCTLPQNIQDNLNYPEVEFVVLDYGSTDGLADWIRDDMEHHIQKGTLHFYRTDRHSRYRPSHSRNVSFRLATGDVVVNVDADNYVGRGFARRINQCLQNRHTIGLPENFLLPYSDRVLLKGRFAMHKADLIELGGYDEDLDEAGYSNEDLHFVFRAMMANYRVVRFENRYTANRIETPESDKIKHMTVTETFQRLKEINEEIIGRKLVQGEIVSNLGRVWGKDSLIHNFCSAIQTP